MAAGITDETWVETGNPTHLELIGKIVVVFSQMEGFLCEMFSQYSGMPEAASRAITARLQLRPMSEMLMSEMLLAIVTETQTNLVIVNDVADIISEIAKITEERNKIVHWEWMISGVVGSGVTRFYKSRTVIQGLPEVTRYGKPELRALITRIQVIIHRIFGHIMDPAEDEKGPPSLAPPRPWLGKP